jgi:ATP-dependent DNA helicase RecG
LDRAFFEGTYLAAAVAPDVLAANQRSYEERLAATKMIVSAAEPVPTVLGLLVLGITTRDFLPGAYVQFLRLAGTTLADAVIDDQVIDGNLSALITRLEEKLTSHNRTAVNITGGAVEQRTPTFPMTALQQLVRNAILHRTYQDTNAPVRISWYSDRLEIISPGGPFGEVTIENFGRPGVTDYRNPNLAEALRSLGFIQRFGAGIPIARQAIEQNGNPPLQFHVEPTYVGITIRART